MHFVASNTCVCFLCTVGYTMDTLYFTWIDKPVDIDKGLQLPQFSMQGYVKRDCSQNYTAGFCLRAISSFYLFRLT